jgi:hypothetical protein
MSWTMNNERRRDNGRGVVRELLWSWCMRRTLRHMSAAFGVAEDAVRTHALRDTFGPNYREHIAHANRWGRRAAWILKQRWIP